MWHIGENFCTAETKWIKNTVHFGLVRQNTRQQRNTTEDKSASVVEISSRVSMQSWQASTKRDGAYNSLR